MALSDELLFAPAHRLAALLKRREVSATELISAFLERIESVNPKLNAIVTLVEERALEEAEEADRRLGGKGDVRPLEGVPITVKDHFQTAGVRSTFGMKIFEHYVPQHDTPIVGRMRAAGAIVIGKTNVPEMAYDYDCDNPLFGPTANPWDLERVPGGSSGGEAAAIAVGMSPLGLGSDLGGSIRVPSHFCGIMGLKTTPGAVPTSGAMPPAPAAPPPIAAMGVFGPMARSVDDLTLAYNLMRGPHHSAPHSVPTFEARPERVNLKQLRCAVVMQVGEAPVDRDICAAVERAVKALAKIGVAIDDARPPISEFPKVWVDLLTADGNELLHEMLGENIRLSRERLRAQMPRRPGKSAADFFRISMERDRLRAELAEFMERCPVIIAPPFGVSAFRHGAFEIELDGQTFPLWAAGNCATWVNCAGLPAAAVPAGLDRSGLPIGVQIIGRAFDEETVLAVSRALEGDLGGFVRPPLKD